MTLDTDKIRTVCAESKSLIRSIIFPEAENIVSFANSVEQCSQHIARYRKRIRSFIQ